MRIIDADEFKEQLKQRYTKAVEWKSKTVYYERADGAIATYLEAIRTLNSAPTVDAVPVVRCKDCKYFLSDDKACNIFYSVTTEDDYCSSGERKDDSN